jgi:predicted DNA-binding antitoxin AbrB/MazE fold protein
MSDHVPAIFDAGVFRPLEPVDWPNGTRAEVTLVGSQSEGPAKQWPTSYFEQTAGAFQGEVFERPTQGELPQRDAW